MAGVTVVAQVRSLAQELPHAVGIAKNKNKNKKNFKTSEVAATEGNIQV